MIFYISPVRAACLFLSFKQQKQIEKILAKIRLQYFPYIVGLAQT